MAAGSTYVHSQFSLLSSLAELAASLASCVMIALQQMTHIELDSDKYQMKYISQPFLNIFWKFNFSGYLELHENRIGEVRVALFGAGAVTSIYKVLR